MGGRCVEVRSRTEAIEAWNECDEPWYDELLIQVQRVARGAGFSYRLRAFDGDFRRPVLLPDALRVRDKR